MRTQNNRSRSTRTPAKPPASPNPAEPGRTYTDKEIADVRSKAVEAEREREALSPWGRVDGVRDAIRGATRGILELQNAAHALACSVEGPGAKEWLDKARANALEALWALHVEAEFDLVELAKHAVKVPA